MMAFHHPLGRIMLSRSLPTLGMQVLKSHANIRCKKDLVIQETCSGEDRKKHLICPSEKKKKRLVGTHY